ncbi:MAG: MBL fold metallo-hydrolase [Chloroflexi bacterium]|nr:MBL fold metallo-hydrolase [Chloroflexota bacterium]
MTTSKFTTANGRIIYRFPVRAFPELIANIHLIRDGERTFLVDCGSGLPDSNQQLLDGFQAVRDAYGEDIRLETLDAILLTHGGWFLIMRSGGWWRRGGWRFIWSRRGWGRPHGRI